ncbi:YjbQ family protein [archaeon]|jgi:secondary thiamine-phosphate synthase enzyme|nr:YjbQ family protein [archaeon]MBT3577194.1 YjbQ family protein [archaeon]MBT6820202.1 YjbQ family protein [archaeon]MBT6956215.1 YjbQ family protein [archaeon]MBT7025408.1 YjbQ family protein [archaeon]
MKSFMKHLLIRTEKEKEIVNITRDVGEAIIDSGIKEGIALVNSMHITSSVFINDEESGLKEDFMEWLEKLAPTRATPDGYRHHRTGEVNGDAHLKRTIMGREVVVAITDGQLDFGPWEQIFYGEFDGRRDKRVLVKVIGE